jgi:hypothetical protein
MSLFRLSLLVPYISLQSLGGLDHELRSNEHELAISSAGPYGPYPAASMNHANAFNFPPTRYHSSTMPVGYDDDPPHLATVGVHLPILILPSLMVALSKGPGGHQGSESQRQLGGHPTLSPGMTQRIPFAPGPPRLEYDASAITVRVPSPHPFSRALTTCLYFL